jgi:membrane-bound ClpP family serine protease
MAKKKTKKGNIKSKAKIAVKAMTKVTPESKGFGVASLILGICSIVFSGVWLLGIVLGMLGVIFAVIQGRIKPNKVQTAGLVVSIVGLILVVFVAVANYQRGILG